MYPSNASAPQARDTVRGVALPDTPRIILVVPWWVEVRKLMDEKGISQEDLAPILGVKTRGAVGHYLSGRRKMKAERFYALLKHLGVEAKDLFEPPTAPDPRRILRAIESLPPESQVILQKVVDTFAKSAPWDEVTERREGKEGKG
jgi:transcriptional regulator with XRE-family HTH domain